MISWLAYSPRRARDVGAWLSAKGIRTRDQLALALAELRIDPTTFPEDAACAYLDNAQSNSPHGHVEIPSSPTQFDPAPAGLAQTVPVKQKRGLRSSEPS